jgi:hypothetical protein
MYEWLKFFTATLIMELAALLILRLGLIRLNINIFKAFFIGNIVTHPVLYYLSLTMTRSELMVGELFVVFVESTIFIFVGKLKATEAIGVALFINGVSWGSKFFVATYLN